MVIIVVATVGGSIQSHSVEHVGSSQSHNGSNSGGDVVVVNERIVVDTVVVE